MTKFTMMDLYVTDNGIGNSAFTGLLGTVGTVGSFVTCMAFGFVYGKLKNKSSIPSYIIIACGFFVLCFVQNATVALVTCTIMGAAWGNVYSYWYLKCTLVVPENMTGTSIGITSTVNSMCSFACPYVLLFLKDIMNTDNTADTFIVYGTIVAIVAVAAVIMNLREKVEN